MVNYHRKKPLFLGLKYCSNLLSYCSYLLSFQGKFNVINIPLVIYLHSTVITKVMLLYNTEWWYHHGMAVNYRGKMLYSTNPWGKISKNYLGVNLLTLLCKLDHFINISNTYGIAMKRPSLRKSHSEFDYSCTCKF